MIDRDSRRVQVVTTRQSVTVPTSLPNYHYIDTMDDTPDPATQFFPGVTPEDIDLYATLGRTKEAKPDDIRKAYRKLALVYHPDKHANSSDSAKEEASIKFQQVGFSYTVLSDETRRKRYDQTGRTDEGAGLEPGEGGWEAYFEDLFDNVTRGKLDEMKKEYQGMPLSWKHAILS